MNEDWEEEFKQELDHLADLIVHTPPPPKERFYIALVYYDKQDKQVIDRLCMGIWLKRHEAAAALPGFRAIYGAKVVIVTYQQGQDYVDRLLREEKDLHKPYERIL